MVFSNTVIPDSLKGGIECPIYKNGGKPKDDPNSYRRITVTSTIGKDIKNLHLPMNQKSICKQQSCFQKGFTEGGSPVIAGLVLTELNIEARETHIPLYIALTDAKKAFDVVWHEGLFREIFKMNIIGDNWLLFKEWYRNLTTKIKWEGQISSGFQEKQGVRQGEVWSPTAYTVFINSLLNFLSSTKLVQALDPFIVEYLLSPTMSP